MRFYLCSNEYHIDYDRQGCQNLVLILFLFYKKGRYTKHMWLVDVCVCEVFIMYNEEDISYLIHCDLTLLILELLGTTQLFQ
jgi:hypothetical protein